MIIDLTRLKKKSIIDRLDEVMYMAPETIRKILTNGFADKPCKTCKFKSDTACKACKFKG